MKLSGMDATAIRIANKLKRNGDDRLVSDLDDLRAYCDVHTNNRLSLADLDTLTGKVVENLNKGEIYAL